MQNRKRRAATCYVSESPRITYVVHVGFCAIDFLRANSYIERMFLINVQP